MTDQHNDPIRDLAQTLDECGMTFAFGLKAQGHIPTIERMLTEKKPWCSIAKEIGWIKEALLESWIYHLSDQLAEPRPAEEKCPRCNGRGTIATIKPGLKVQVSVRHRECARELESPPLIERRPFFNRETHVWDEDEIEMEAVDIIAKHFPDQSAEIERLRAENLSLEQHARAHLDHIGDLNTSISNKNQDIIFLEERVKALEEGLNKAVITLDFVATASGHPISRDAEATLSEIKPLLQPAKEVK